MRSQTGTTAGYPPPKLSFPTGWYRKAADAGEPRGMSLKLHGMSILGFMYEEGRGGLLKDYAEVVSWYRKAVALGDTYAKGALKRLVR